MKKIEDIYTQEFPVVCEVKPSEVEPVEVKRGRGRPPTGKAMTAAQRMAKRRALLKEAGMVQATVMLPVEVAQRLDMFVQFKDMSKSDVVAKALRNSIMRSR